MSSSPSHFPTSPSQIFPFHKNSPDTSPPPAPVLVPFRYILIAQVESWPDLISVITGCLSRVQQPFKLKDAEDGVVVALFP